MQGGANNTGKLHLKQPKASERTTWCSYLIIISSHFFDSHIQVYREGPIAKIGNENISSSVRYCPVSAYFLNWYTYICFNPSSRGGGDFRSRPPRPFVCHSQTAGDSELKLSDFADTFIADNLSNFRPKVRSGHQVRSPLPSEASEELRLGDGRAGSAVARSAGTEAGRDTHGDQPSNGQTERSLALAASFSSL